MNFTRCDQMPKAPVIGTLQERSLHASLKELYMRGDARVEVSIDGFVVDVVKDNLLIEIQTRNFAAIKKKLFSLLKNHPVRLVYPLPKKKWIVKQKTSKKRLSRAVGKMSRWCRTNRHRKVREQHEHICKMIVGHINYYGVTGPVRNSV